MTMDNWLLGKRRTDDPQAIYKYLVEHCGSVKIEFAMPEQIPLNERVGGVSTFPYEDLSATKPERVCRNSGETEYYTLWRDVTKSANLYDNQNYYEASTGTGSSLYTVFNLTNQIPTPPTGYIVFGPNDTWPVMIRVTMRVYDGGMTTSTYDDEQGIEHGGQTYSFVVPLP